MSNREIVRGWYLFALRDELPLGDKSFGLESHVGGCFDRAGNLACSAATCDGTQVSLWQYAGTDAGFDQAMTASSKALVAVLGESTPSPRQEAEPDPLPHGRAVAFVAARWPKEEGDRVSAVHYRKCMAAIQDAVRALRHATRARIPNVTIERMWPMYMRGAEYADGSRKALGPVIVEHGFLGTEPAGDETLELAAQLALSAAGGHPVEIYRDFELGARNAALVDGDYVEAAIKASTACEILLKHVAWVLTWEATTQLSVDPVPGAPVVAALFEGKPSTLIGSVLAVRLKGSWTSQHPTKPIGAWRSHVAKLRNQVIHRGHRPSEAEMHDLLDAMVRLERHVFGRIVAMASVYPRTALMFLSDRDLERRGALGKVRDVAQDPDAGYWWTDYLDWLGPQLDAAPADADS